MSNTNNSMQERLAETRAVAEATMVLRILTELAGEPSTKRFNRSRDARFTRWQHLEAVAREQAKGLATLSEPAVVETGAPIAQVTYP